tara:strand:+ start:1287 stop:1628 length:342 start_codon:yes stop_codon:yes gene_type:complete
MQPPCLRKTNQFNFDAGHGGGENIQLSIKDNNELNTIDIELSTSDIEALLSRDIFDKDICQRLMDDFPPKKVVRFSKPLLLNPKRTIKRKPKKKRKSKKRNSCKTSWPKKKSI